MNIRNIWTGVAAFMLCTNVPAMEDVRPSGIQDVKAPGIQDVKAPGMERAVPPPTSQNQKGLSRQYINMGCVIVGENIECPGQLSEYRHTFEPPQFGQIWKLYIPGVAYTTENTVDGTRVLHTSVGANLPNNALQINQNGTYLWKIDGKVMKGRWVQEDEHAFVLKNGYRGVDWRASIEKFGAEEQGRLLLWNDWDRLAGRLK